MTWKRFLRVLVVLVFGKTFEDDAGFYLKFSSLLFSIILFVTQVVNILHSLELFFFFSDIPNGLACLLLCATDVFFSMLEHADKKWTLSWDENSPTFQNTFVSVFMVVLVIGALLYYPALCKITHDVTNLEFTALALSSFTTMLRWLILLLCYNTAITSNPMNAQVVKGLTEFYVSSLFMRAIVVVMIIGLSNFLDTEEGTFKAAYFQIILHLCALPVCYCVITLSANKPEMQVGWMTGIKFFFITVLAAGVLYNASYFNL